MVLTIPKSNPVKNPMSLTSALELEIAEYYPQLRVFRLYYYCRADSAADAKQAGDGDDGTGKTVKRS